jgi:trans-aconitate 2-methyltransferase
MTALAWSPEQYGCFAAPRLRPGLDLLARVPLGEDARTVVDLGCGAGALFPALRVRFPKARLVGVDLSPEMLAKAAAADPRAELVRADAATWRPVEPVDLVLANASLHWVPDHERLLPDLLRCTRVLAVQVPLNFASSSHRLTLELAAEPPWAERLEGLELGEHVLEPAAYHALLRGAGADVDLWETIYHHVLAGPDPVLAWLKGTALLSVAAALGDAMPAFEQALASRLAVAYPSDASGITLFPFRRLFLIAVSR